jgi:hypothetical protein
MSDLCLGLWHSVLVLFNKLIMPCAGLYPFMGPSDVWFKPVTNVRWPLITITPVDPLASVVTPCLSILEFKFSLIATSFE